MREPNELTFVSLEEKVKVTKYARFLCRASKVRIVGVMETVRQVGVMSEMRV